MKLLVAMIATEKLYKKTEYRWSIYKKLTKTLKSSGIIL